MSSAKELLAAGRLNDAIQAMNDEVKRNPTDIQRRGFLAELLCASGRLERESRSARCSVPFTP